MGAIVADPFGEDIGYEAPKLKGDIVTISHHAPGHNRADMVKGANFTLDRPGEYEIGGVFITGISTYNPAEPTRLNVIYTYDFAGVMVCHLGDLDYIPKQPEIEALGPIDVLLVPVGGGGALNSAQASEVISLIEPSIVVPMHYATSEVNVPLDDLDKFLKEMGLSEVQTEPVLKVAAGKLPEETQVVVLEYTR